MNNRDITQEIITRMSTLSHAFKILAGTAYIGMITCMYNENIHTSNIGFILIIALFIIMDLYYFYMEKYFRKYINDNNIPKIKWLDIQCIFKVATSFSIWFYYGYMLISFMIINYII